LTTPLFAALSCGRSGLDGVGLPEPTIDLSAATSLSFRRSALKDSTLSRARRGNLTHLSIAIFRTPSGNFWSALNASTAFSRNAFNPSGVSWNSPSSFPASSMASGSNAASGSAAGCGTDSDSPLGSGVGSGTTTGGLIARSSASSRATLHPILHNSGCTG